MCKAMLSAQEIILHMEEMQKAYQQASWMFHILSNFTFLEEAMCFSQTAKIKLHQISVSSYALTLKSAHLFISFLAVSMKLILYHQSDSIQSCESALCCLANLLFSSRDLLEQCVISMTKRAILELNHFWLCN